MTSYVIPILFAKPQKKKTQKNEGIIEWMNELKKYVYIYLYHYYYYY